MTRVIVGVIAAMSSLAFAQDTTTARFEVASSDQAIQLIAARFSTSNRAVKLS
jgi:hypothetical protein